ncbi:MAG: putative metal-binding motif-containing protein [Alphaproteobacteria bacterium]|nr:putative metal-binding motif-containing protein [Alphaproteobacteria bacterium]
MAAIRPLLAVPLLCAVTLPAAAVQGPRDDVPVWTFALPAGVVAREVLALNLNGDIYPDLVVSVPTEAQPGRTWIFLGGPTLPSAPSAEIGVDAVGITGGASDAFGAWGDIDGDGFDDQLTWVGDPISRHRTLQYRRGSADGLTVQPTTVTIDDYRVNAVFGHMVPVGPILDQNGDGMGDVTFRAAEADGVGTRAHFEVHLGTVNGVDRRPAWTHIATDTTAVAGAPRIIGDSDPDGIREIAYTSSYPREDGTWRSSLVVIKGDVDGPRDAFWAAMTVDFPVSGPDQVRIVGTGDVDRDGRDEIAVLIHPDLPGEPDRLLLYFGDDNYAVRLAGPTTVWTSAGTSAPPSFLGLADFDGDLELEYAVGMPGAGMGGTAYGGVSVAINDFGTFRQNKVLDFLGLGDDRGAGVAGAFADFDADNRSDLLISVAGDDTHPGSLQLLRGFLDTDLDGYDDEVDDCAPRDAEIHPGAVEVWYDGIDQDCDGNDDDQDVDGFDKDHDCDDTDPDRNPGVAEIWYDGVDQDCDGNDDDQDEDGVASIDHGGLDCDDTDATINPRANDIPENGIDENCDGADATLADGGDIEVVPGTGCGGCSAGGASPASLPGLLALALGLVALRRRDDADDAG